MSTSSDHARHTATDGAVINPGAAADAGVLDPDADHAARLAVAETAATQAIKAARHAAQRLRPRGLRSPVRRCAPSPSPERHRGRGGSRMSPAVQTVYKDSDVGAPWPMLTKTNYDE
jgi:hypothetical protein